LGGHHENSTCDRCDRRIGITAAGGSGAGSGDQGFGLNSREDGPWGARAAIRESYREQSRFCLRSGRSFENANRPGCDIWRCYSHEAAHRGLAGEGKIDTTRATIAHAGIGVAIHKGAPKPDIGTTEAFKRALLSAKSVGFTAAGASGVYLKTLFEKLGIADELKPKLKLLQGGAGEAAANGEVEIGMTQISEILPYANAELVGPLPSDIQSYTYFTAGVSVASKEADAAKAFIKFLAAPAALTVIKAKGMEPG